MTWLTENPLWICTTGLFLGSCLFFFFVHTRRKAFAFLGTTSILIAVFAYVASFLIVTDNEAVRATCRALARGVNANSTSDVMKHISSSTDFYDRARSEMEACHFTRCWISDSSEVEFSTDRKGRRFADIRLAVLVSVTESPYGGGNAKIELNLTFAKENDGKWRVHAYNWKPANVQDFNKGTSQNGY